MPDPIRLALIITELEPGGAERCLVNLGIRLNQRQFAPVVYSLAPQPAAGREQLVQKLISAGVPVHFLGLKHWWQYFEGVNQMARLLGKQRADVVQTFLFHANVIGTRAAYEAGVSRVFAGVRVADPRRWRTRLERWAAAKATSVVCVSEETAAHCRQRGFKAEKLVVIPNGIEVERWQNAQPANLQEFGVDSAAPIVIYVGRLDRQKGVDDLIHSFPKVVQKVPECRLLIIGDGPDWTGLKRLAVQLGVEKQVHFGGWRVDVPALIAAANLLVVPSRWEGMPNVVLEAMAASKPIVATRVEGIAEVLGERAADQTVARGDKQALVERMTSLIRNPLLQKELGVANQNRAVAQFGLNSMVFKYAALYAAKTEAQKLCGQR
jgi:glycosyltransferase involved in cell wall biosynthesis